MNKSPTPLIQQYLEIKSKYKDSILFYRLGDFYEMFFEDAITVAPILDLTLTSRHKDVEEPIPMCGVPYHSVGPYIKKLLDTGFKVAICEQLEDPSKAKGIVKRDVIRVVTPGLVYDPDMLEANKTNYMAVLEYDGNTYGVAFFEPSIYKLLLLSTNEKEQVFSELKKLMPKELLYKDKFFPNNIITMFGNEVPFILTPIPENYFNWDTIKDRIIGLWGEQIIGAGVSDNRTILSTISALFHYLEDTKTPVSNVTINTILPSTYLYMDSATIRNLELFSSIIDNSEKLSLIGVLDKTITSMGARMLSNYLKFPSVSVSEIQKRHTVVDYFFNEPVLRAELRNKLKDITDIERTATKSYNQSLTPQSLERLADSLVAIKTIKQMLNKGIDLLSQLYESMDELLDIHTEIKYHIDLSEKQGIHGWFINTGVDAQLDELKSLVKDAKGWLKSFEKEERERTGISSLKVGYSSVFGYYIEVTKPNLRLVPQDYIRKQTIANGERFITHKLKEMEAKLLSAEEEIKIIEAGYLRKLNELISKNAMRILKTGSAIGHLDVLLNFAEIAVRNNYTKPIVDESDTLELTDARHPVIEQFLKGETFIPNDIVLNNTEKQIVIITGPNMAGKSTIIRQTALIVIMAQMGSFVPAKYAKIGIVDRIFARVGASDHLAKGQSTFMVEMTETAYILNNATYKSLIILDEIGRGTSTYDGISIAWAVLDYIANNIGAKTLFATHYHELIEFGQSHPKATNQSLPVKQWQGKLIFLRKLMDGGSSESFGIEVAKMAGLPKDVISLARRLLKKLQDGEIDSLGRPRLSDEAKSHEVQFTLFKPEEARIIDTLKNINSENMTPLEALQLLVKLKEMINDKR